VTREAVFPLDGFVTLLSEALISCLRTNNNPRNVATIPKIRHIFARPTPKAFVCLVMKMIVSEGVAS
jgi:hypothetical protein